MSKPVSHPYPSPSSHLDPSPRSCSTETSWTVSSFWCTQRSKISSLVSNDHVLRHVWILNQLVCSLFFFTLDIYRIVSSKALESSADAVGPTSGSTITVTPTSDDASKASGGGKCCWSVPFFSLPPPIWLFPSTFSNCFSLSFLSSHLTLFLLFCVFFFQNKNKNINMKVLVKIVKKQFLLCCGIFFIDHQTEENIIFSWVILFFV
jgi:hypothetical protein